MAGFVEVVSLRKHFPLRTGFIQALRKNPEYLFAVDGVSFTITRGEVFGLVGESGSGKTTTGKLTIRLIEPTSGAVRIGGVNIFSLNQAVLRASRKKMQMIFQDPYESLNPRERVIDAVTLPLRVHHAIRSPTDKLSNAKKLLETVDLEPAGDFLYKFPHQLSGGQRQRVALARALSLRPEYIVADEPVSMLDLSIRAEMLRLMLKLREEFNLTYLFITHDLGVARYACRRTAVMYLGKIVEIGPTEEVISNPLHPYTKLLTSSAPVPDPKVKKDWKILAIGEIPSAANPPPGCRFHPRCAMATSECSSVEPRLLESEVRAVACHHA